MEGISEEHEAANIGAGGRNLRGDPPAHRFAADYQCTAADLLVPNSLDDSPETCLEGIIRVRNAPALLRVRKIECDDVNSARCETGRQSRHEITSLIGTSAVPKDYRDIHLASIGRRIDEGGHFLVRGNSDAQFLRHDTLPLLGSSALPCLGCRGF